MISVDFIIFNALLDEYIAVLRILQTLNRREQKLQPLNPENELLSYWPSAIGVEMEGSGIATLLERRNLLRRFCMIRGVSDLANENKRIDSANWSQFACDASAAYTFSIILSLAKKGFFDPSA